jgi:molybdopterin synthase sulfur carrier subunit
MIKVKFFAMLRGLAGTETTEYDAGGAGSMTLDELKGKIREDFPELAPVLDSRSVFISVNLEFASRDAVINDGDEVAFLPPFSGG